MTDMELILEIGPADGDLPYALDLVHAAKESGADWVKGQIYNRDLLTTPTAKTYAHDIQVPETQYEDFAHQLTYDEWATVKQECDATGIGFFFSPFDFDAVHFGEQLGVERYKVASGDITYKQLLERLASTGKLLLVSTGASTEREVEQATNWVQSTILLACSLSYPTNPHDANLRRMETLRKHSAMVGYSDHTYGTGAIHRARHLGAVVVEKHFTLKPGTGGDHDFAVTPEQVKTIWEYGWDSGSTVYDGTPSLTPTLAEWKARKGARRSLVANHTITGPLEADDVVMLRPGVGIPPYELDTYLGLVPVEPIPAGTVITQEMFQRSWGRHLI